MNYLDDLTMVYKKATMESLKRIKKNPIVLLLPFIYSLIMFLLNNVIYRMGFFTGGSYLMGFIVGMVYAAIISSYFYLLSDLHYYNKISFKNLGSSFKSYFYGIYSAYFIMMLINILSSFFGGNISFIIFIAVFVIFNPLSETIYIKGESYTSAYGYSMNFMKENFVHWIMPLAVYMLVCNALGYHFISIFGRGIIALTLGIDVSTMFGGNQWIMALLIQIVTAIYVVFRAELFSILSTSTMRKRQYMGGI